MSWSYFGFVDTVVLSDPWSNKTLSANVCLFPACKGTGRQQ